MSALAISEKMTPGPLPNRVVVTGTQGSSLSSGRSSAASCIASARSSSPETRYTCWSSTRSPRFSRSSRSGETESATSMRTMSPKRRRCSSSCTASSRSFASSSTSKSASLVSRKVAHSRISICGKSDSRKWAMTSSSGRKRPRAAHLDEPGQPLRHLDAGEPLLPGLGVADEDPEAEREGGDVGEGLAGPHGERRQHRIDLLPETDAELRELLLRAVCDRADPYALGGERRQQVVRPQLRLPRVELLDARADLGEHRSRRAAVVGAHVQPRRGLVEQARDANGEELVHVGREERRVLHALQQRRALVERLLEHPPAPVEPGKLSVQQPARRLGASSDGRLAVDGLRSLGHVLTLTGLRACSQLRAACG